MARPCSCAVNLRLTVERQADSQAVSDRKARVGDPFKILKTTRQVRDLPRIGMAEPYPRAPVRREPSGEKKRGGECPPPEQNRWFTLVLLFLLFQFLFDQYLREFGHNFPGNLSHYPI